MNSEDNRKMDRTKKKIEIIREGPVTYGEYAEMPEDGNRYEIVDGSLLMMSPSASSIHQMVSHEMEGRLSDTCKEDYFILHAPLDMILSPTEVRQPDIVMIHRDRVHIITKRGIEGPPDLAVEILSPASIKNDKVSKLKTYARFGIYEYWIVDTSNASLEQYLLQEDQYLLHELYTKDEPVQSDHISCVSFTMNDIMARIPDLAD